jgi:hypothetical protein
MLKLLKIKTLGLVIILLALSASNSAFGQELDYHSVSTEVQNKLDQNKVQGLPLLSGVWIEFDLTFWANDGSARLNILKNILSSDLQAEMIQSSPSDEMRLIFRCPAINGFDQIKEKISPIGFEMNELHQYNFFVKQ